MAMKSYPLEKAFTFIEPGPVLLVTTYNESRYNIMAITWHMVLDFTPKIAVATGPWNYSFNALLKNRECVLAVPTIELAEKTVHIGDCSGKTIDKFQQFGLTALPAEKIKAPLIGECLACIECKVTDYLESQNFFVLQGINAWYDEEHKEIRKFHANGDGTFVTDGPTLDLRNLMEDKLPAGV
ncbi:flavin reductase family protein [Pectinatus haikarae]|uniref:Flavin reductase (DIM6/NTAB) family NADH-FMN oxidoreductase RutF n=2 Tax=Pectinatus haikarae TaxID=349096 RepID=A0ABT9YB97_9FIRM|nr:flavin reductase family protein [Pectinatus haikarae]MDQ0205082.1 flavin reductase (DIM6/NTAB) family NADH-FMN oxidoreductase RutF [Pectinatus haikarae]